jgi:hypothetical protein
MRFGFVALASVGMGMWSKSAWAALMLCAILLLLDDYYNDTDSEDD